MPRHSTDCASLVRSVCDNAVIHRVVRGVVLEKLFDGKSLPVEFFRCAANQVRQIPIQPKLVSKRQRLNRFFNFLNSSHEWPRCIVKRDSTSIAFLLLGRATILRCPPRIRSIIVRPRQATFSRRRSRRPRTPATRARAAPIPAGSISWTDSMACNANPAIKACPCVVGWTMSQKK